jgi:hypothetical protein
MSASKEHDLIVALIARYIRQQGFEIVALETSLSWLFGDSFHLPPAVVHHRPDVLGVRAEPPYISLGEAKTCGDLKSQRTARQLIDFSQIEIDSTGIRCQVTVGVPQDCESLLQRLIYSLKIPDNCINVLPVPRSLLDSRTK